MLDVGRDVVLALLGAILTIVLIVLDKAGKLRGPALLIMLGVAAAMALPLALGNSWVTHAPTETIRSARIALLCLMVGAIYSVLTLWISAKDAHEAFLVIRSEPESETKPRSSDVSRVLLQAFPQGAEIRQRKLYVSFYWQNFGPEPTLRIHHISRAYLITPNDQNAINEAITDFKRKVESDSTLARSSTDVPLTTVVNDAPKLRAGVWGIDRLSDKQIKEFRKRQKTALVVAALRFKDSGGSHEKRFCAKYNPSGSWEVLQDYAGQVDISNDADLNGPPSREIILGKPMPPMPQ